MRMESNYAPLDVMPNDVEREYLFGPFRFVPARQRLWCGDTPLRVGSRALDILAVLAERAGEVVGKQELIARAWPSTVVEDSNLKVQLSALRRALSEGQRGCGDHATEYVATVTGRGYRFVAPISLAVQALPVGLAAAAARGAAAQAHNLPAAITRAIGRADAVASLLGTLAQRRIVTVVGPGGIGKTTVALAAALDWSYEFLPEDERLILRALSVFTGPFTLDAAAQLLAGGALASGQIVDGVANLVEKSLLAADLHGATVHYRLFGATRAYALDKLESDGEAAEMRRRRCPSRSASWAALQGRGTDRASPCAPATASPCRGPQHEYRAVFHAGRA